MFMDCPPLGEPVYATGILVYVDDFSHVPGPQSPPGKSVRLLKVEEALRVLLKDTEMHAGQGVETLRQIVVVAFNGGETSANS